MKFFVVLLLCVAAASAQKTRAKSSGVAAGKFVWDLLKPALNAAEVQALLAQKGGESQWPTLDQLPADLAFDCASKKQPGFYADEKYQCQVFHRCDINGNMTSFLCVNTTVFNQITLVCDYWFNVECGRSAEFEDFANSRLYTNQPLFDSPPDDYVAPQSAGTAAAAASVSKSLPTNNKPAPSKPVAKPVAKPSGGGNKPSGGGVKVGGSASISAQSRQDEEVNAAASANAAGTNVEAPAAEATTAAAEETTAAAAAEETTAAAAEETTAAAAGGEETTAAAGGEETTAAAAGEETTAAAAGGEETTAAAAGGEETTAAAAGGEETTAAAGGEEATTAAA